MKRRRARRHLPGLFSSARTRIHRARGATLNSPVDRVPVDRIPALDKASSNVSCADSGHGAPIAARPGWQRQLRDAIRRIEDLADAVRLPVAALPFSAAADRDFPLRVPRAFAARMRPGDPRDPLLLQVLAARAEEDADPAFTRDPLGEVSHYAGTPGVLRKYHGRALFVVSAHCAVNCRYCFRRHYPYGENAVSSRQRLDNIDRLLGEAPLRELILSGGDPLLLSDRQIAAIVERIASRRPDVTLRIHTRLPVVIPERVTGGLLRALRAHTAQVVVVLHSNHPHEIDEAAGRAIACLRDARVTVLNQSVLLAGINDRAEVLAALSDRLFAHGALPYYLHRLDRVAGARHFEVPLEESRRILGRLAALRPGYLVPKLVMETPGAVSKQEIAPIYPVP